MYTHLSLSLLFISLPFSKARYIPDPRPNTNVQTPAGYTQTYQNLPNLPSSQYKISSFSSNDNLESPNTCAKTCDSLANCKFFAIYSPKDGQNFVCSYYSKRRPFGDLKYSMKDTSPIEDFRGFEKNAAKVKGRPIQNGTANGRWNGTYHGGSWNKTHHGHPKNDTGHGRGWHGRDGKKDEKGHKHDGRGYVFEEKDDDIHHHDQADHKQPRGVFVPTFQTSNQEMEELGDMRECGFTCRTWLTLRSLWRR